MSNLKPYMDSGILVVFPEGSFARIVLCYLIRVSKIFRAVT